MALFCGDRVSCSISGISLTENAFPSVDMAPISGSHLRLQLEIESWIYSKTSVYGTCNDDGGVDLPLVYSTACE